MLGIASPITVSRILRTVCRPPAQIWRTFLHNHVDQVVSTDFFTVHCPGTRGRKVLHFNMTEHPTGAWTAQQIVEAFADRDSAHYLIRDRDHAIA